MKEKRTIPSVKKQIAGFFRERKRMPTYEEMVALLGVRSKSVVHFWINKLVEAKILEKDRGGHLTWKERPFSIPMVGEVAAGFPSPEEEELRDILSLDEYLVARPDASFLLHVSGDSMTGAGILPGDLVIVEKGREPKKRRCGDRRSGWRVDHENLPERKRGSLSGSGQSEISDHSASAGIEAGGGGHGRRPEISPLRWQKGSKTGEKVCFCSTVIWKRGLKNANHDRSRY